MSNPLNYIEAIVKPTGKLPFLHADKAAKHKPLYLSHNRKQSLSFIFNSYNFFANTIT